MNLDGEKFQDLLELFPETAENLKLRSLEKRSIFMYYKSKVTKKVSKNTRNIMGSKDFAEEEIDE